MIGTATVVRVTRPMATARSEAYNLLYTQPGDQALALPPLLDGPLTKDSKPSRAALRTMAESSTSPGDNETRKTCQQT